MSSAPMSGFLNKPKYTITDEVLSLTANIAAKADVVSIKSDMGHNPNLRRGNRVRTIHSSLAIAEASDKVFHMSDGVLS